MKNVRHRTRKSPKLPAKPRQPQAVETDKIVSVAWMEAHRDCAIDSVKRLISTPLSTLMTLCVVGIALLLPAILQLINVNLNAIDQGFVDDAQLTVYLRDTVSESEGRNVSDNLLTMEGIESVVYLSKAAVLQDFAEHSGLGDLVQQLDENPLPATILVVPVDKSAEGARRTYQYLQSLPEVELVQMDLEWLQRLEGFRSMLGRINLVFSAILAVAVLFIIGNTIRLAIENRRTEIAVVKLVGGTNSYAARPFLYTGVLLGLAGGMLAGLLLLLVLFSFNGPLQSLLGLYGSEFQFTGIGFAGFLSLVLSGALLGWLGAVISVFQQLRAIGDG
ncbi:MAG: permease-like cell division protein FtsX [Pseudohongiellaceae bacterium]